MSTTHRPVQAPHPETATAVAAGLLAVDALHSELVTQRNRALTYTLAGLALLLAKATGAVEIDLWVLLAVLTTGYLNVVLFSLLWRRAARANRRVDLGPWWISCDVIFITCLVGLTGGLSSPWFVLYLGCAGAAVAHCRRPFIVGAGAGTAALYFGLLVAMGQIHGLDRNFVLAASQLLCLLGASLFLLLFTYRLRELLMANHRLKEEAVTRVEELTRVTRELEAMSRLLRDFSELDPLTNLHNRRYFNDRVALETERRTNDRRAAGKGAGLVLIDIDHFKTINDTAGHAAGDEVLKHLARVLRSCVRGDDWLVRWGGDEFLILLPHCATERARRIAERVVAAVRSQPCNVSDGRVLELSCSVGWSVFDWGVGQDGAPRWESALAMADAALYVAKREGRGCSRCLPPNCVPAPREPALDAAPTH